MTGKCMLMGFRSGKGQTKTYEEWATHNLITTIGVEPKPPELTYAEWTRKNFITAYEGEIPDPPSTQKSVLVDWALQYFITVG